MLQVLLQCLLIFTIVFSCLAYGGVTSVSLALLEAAVGCLVGIWLIDSVYRRKLSFVKANFLLPLFLFFCLAVFQLIPLPVQLLKFISPHTANLYVTFTASDTRNIFFPLSIYPNSTISELLKIFSCLGVFLFVVNTGAIETKKQFDLLINAVIFLGVFISLFGIIQKYTYAHLEKVYWFDPVGSAGAAFGPFANRNNFAGYINMIIPLSLGYFLNVTKPILRLVYGFCVVMMSAALFLSLSRAGILVYGAILLFVLIFSRLKDRLKENTKTLGVWVGLTLLSLFLFVETKVFWERLATLFKKETLVILGHGYSWADILRIWRDFPLFGSGLGTFGSISPMYKTIPAQILFTYAHNDYLQLLSEAGLLGFIFISLFFIFYFKSVVKMWIERHDFYAISLVLAGLSSIFGMLIYSMLDFNLHIPANALLFFIIMGLTYRLAHTRFKDAIYQ